MYIRRHLFLEHVQHGNVNSNRLFILLRIIIDVYNSQCYIQKLLGIGESCDLSGVVKSLCEVHSDMNKKYVTKICDTVMHLLTDKKR